jgi:hypothetical protein
MKCRCGAQAQDAIYFTGIEDDAVPRPVCWQCGAKAVSEWERRSVKERHLRLVMVDLEDLAAYHAHDAARGSAAHA